MTRIRKYIAIFIVLAVASAAAEKPLPRVVLKVGEITVSPDSMLIEVPVYLSNPADTIAGVEMHFVIDENAPLYFALDDVREDGLMLAVDTAGTLMSGWEWMGVNSFGSGFYDLKIAGLADWPDHDMMPPIMPQEDGVLVKIILRNDGIDPFASELFARIAINSEKTGLSDPAGNTIGIVTTIERRCEKYIGDSCLVWKNARVGNLDTTITRFTDGYVRVINSPAKSGDTASGGE